MFGRFVITVAVTSLFVIAACEREPEKKNYRRTVKEAAPTQDVDGDGDIDSADAIPTPADQTADTTPDDNSANPPAEPVKPSALNWDGQTNLGDVTFDIVPAE